MSNQTYVTDVPLGQILNGPVEFIQQIYVEAPKDLFELTLPGQITRCGTASAFAVKPMGRVVINCSEPELGAFVTAQVSDEVALTHAMTELSQKINPKKANGYALRLASRDSSFTDLVAKAQSALGGSGCDCGCSGGGAKLPGSVSIGLLKGNNDNMLWSKPVRAILHAELLTSPEFGPSTKACDAFALGPNATMCKSSWHGFFDRWTECTGPCSSGVCSCGTTRAGTPKISCKGWGTCTCR